jgi:hypothetical protein
MADRASTDKGKAEESHEKEENKKVIKWQKKRAKSVGDW